MKRIKELTVLVALLVGMGVGSEAGALSFNLLNLDAWTKNIQSHAAHYFDLTATDGEGEKRQEQH